MSSLSSAACSSATSSRPRRRSVACSAWLRAMRHSYYCSFESCLWIDFCAAGSRWQEIRPVRAPATQYHGSRITMLALQLISLCVISSFIKFESAACLGSSAAARTTAWSLSWTSTRSCIRWQSAIGLRQKFSLPPPLNMHYFRHLLLLHFTSRSLS